MPAADPGQVVDDLQRVVVVGHRVHQRRRAGAGRRDVAGGARLRGAADVDRDVGQIQPGEIDSGRGVRRLQRVEADLEVVDHRARHDRRPVGDGVLRHRGHDVGTGTQILGGGGIALVVRVAEVHRVPVVGMDVDPQIDEVFMHL